MSGFEGAIQEITQTIFNSVLGVEIQPEDTFKLSLEHAQTLAGVVQISGQWEGAVALQVSVDFARRAGVMMLGLEPDSVTQADMQDALGELSNMVGGNFKALLPEPCSLSLPVVIVGTDYRLRLPGASQVLQVAFRCDGEPLTVIVFQRVLAGVDG